MTNTRIQSLWPWAAIAASVLMLAIAHAFQHLGDMAPCPLCLRQREVYWGALTIGIAGLAAARLAPALFIPRATAALLAVAFLAGAGVAFYHAGAEYKFWPAPASCGVTQAAVTADDLAAALDGPARALPRCDAAPWSLFGISMAGYNGLISLALAGVSLAVAMAPGRPDDAAE
jgi:disulfide bond formation protein DsbB